MEPVKFTRHADRAELVFEGVLDVARARTTYDQLNQALDQALPLELHAAKLERLDAAGLQLLVAFCHAARKLGLNPQWRSTSSALRSSADSLDLAKVLGLPA
jgi:anti-anti-sigma regulatory factor